MPCVQERNTGQSTAYMRAQVQNSAVSPACPPSTSDVNTNNSRVQRRHIPHIQYIQRNEALEIVFTRLNGFLTCSQVSRRCSLLSANTDPPLLLKSRRWSFYGWNAMIQTRRHIMGLSKTSTWWHEVRIDR